jgi:hypothetical protein
VADRQDCETGAALRWRLELRDQERVMLRDNRGLHVRNGNFELRVIRPGCRRIGQPIDRCHHDKHSEQPFQAPTRHGPCCPGSSHCAQDINKVLNTNSRASARVRFNADVLRCLVGVSLRTRMQEDPCVRYPLAVTSAALDRTGPYPQGIHPMHECILRSHVLSCGGRVHSA